MKVLLRETKLMLSSNQNKLPRSLIWESISILKHFKLVQAIVGRSVESIRLLESQSLLMTLICKRLFQANGTSSTSSTETKQVKISL
jgi:hypothetical protein